MRNLKKILALVMALVMSMSLVTIANAADFTDNDDISYEEAADVMNAIGVIEGFEDGSFDPDGTLTREQAAKLVTYMLLGADADNLGIERSSFNDVAMTRWSAPAIEYCVSLGIIDGAGDGNFYPAGQLTAVAFAKVLLTALGYDSDAEGLVGTSWSVNTSALATEVGLDNGIEDLVWSAAITREEAAQMALNTIKAPLVAYEGGVTVIVGDTPVSFGSGDAYYITTTLAREQRISDEQLSNSDDYTVEFGERYFPRLRLIRETDEYERPSYTWVYENTELGTYVNYDLLVETYTEGVDGRTLFELLGRSTIQNYDLTYYVDGKETDLDKDLLVRSNTSDIGATGNGVLTQVFVDHDTNDGEIIITSINTYLAQAVNDYSTTNEYATLRVYTNVDSANQVLTSTYNVDVADVPNVADVTADTFYAVNLSYKNDATYGEVAKIDDVEIMEDCSITGYSSNNGNSTIRDAKVTELTTGGEDYDANAKAFYDDEVLYHYDENLLTDNTYTIYLDQYGYFLGVELFEGSQNYVFVTGFDRNSSNLSVKTATATGIFLDGQMENIQVNVTATDKNIERAWDNHVAGADNALTYVKWSNTGYDITGSDWDDMGKYGEDGIYDLNQWFTYTVNEDNVYTLKPAVRSTWTAYSAKADGSDTVIRTDNLSVENSFPYTVTAPDSYEFARGYVYGNDDTIFLTVDLDVVDTTGGSRKAITEVNGVYTGVQNVDLVVDTRDTNAIQEGQVYTVYDSNGYAIAAVVIGEAQGATGNYAYILSQAKSERLENGTYLWTFDAILDGEKQTLTARGDYNSTIALIGRGDVVELRFDGDYVVDVRTIDNDNIYGNQPAYSNGGRIYETLDGQDIYSMLDLSATNRVASLQMNTLYITANRSDRGLAIASGAKAVVIQSENAKEVITNCSSVSEAVSRLGDPDTSTTIKEYDGDIIAVLNSNGAAEWVVFVSDTPVGTGDAGYGQQGNLPTIYGDDYLVNIDGTGAADDTLDGSTASISYRITNQGLLNTMVATVEYNAPEWVPNNATVTLSIDVLYNNSVVDTMSFNGRIVNDRATLTGTSSDFWRYIGWEDLDSFTFRMTDEVFSDVNVYYYTFTGGTLAMASNSTATMPVDTGKQMFIHLPNSSAGTTTVRYGGEMSWTGDSAANWTGAVSLNSGYNTASLIADGTGPVWIAIDTASRADTYSVTAPAMPTGTFSNAGSAPTGAAMSNFSGAASTDNALLKVWTTAPATSLDEYNRVEFNVQVRPNGPWAAAAYDVVISLSDGTNLRFTNVPMNGVAKSDDSFQMPAANVTITRITVTPKPILSVQSVTAANNVITVTFNTEIDAATVGHYMLSDGSPVTPNKVAFGADHKTVEITLDQAASTITSVQIQGPANAVNTGNYLSTAETWTRQADGSYKK